MRRNRGSLGIIAVALAAFAGAADGGPVRGDDKTKASGRRADQEALEAYAGLVGGWRGAGQVERGRARGAWTESASWAWKLTNDSAGLAVEAPKGKFLKAGTLRPGKAPGTFAFDATLADGSARHFSGKPATVAGKPALVLDADPKDAPDGLRRVSITPLHDTRLIVLFESGGPDRRDMQRLGEVGYTREGATFAAGDASPVCVVTGGRGTTQVTHKGQTYWVCCSGCRDLFNDDPEAVLAEARARDKGGTKP